MQGAVPAAGPEGAAALRPLRDLSGPAGQHHGHCGEHGEPEAADSPPLQGAQDGKADPHRAQYGAVLAGE